MQSDMANARYDLLVVGGTPGGIACAVRAAREGLSVALVNRHAHLGGILSSGLAVWDTLWEGNRSPIYDEIRHGIVDHYRKTFGPDSQPYLDSLPRTKGHLIGCFEARVAEKVMTDLVAREKNVTVLLNYVPAAVDRQGRLLNSVRLESTANLPGLEISASTFADCTYEGDLAALAGVPYRVGREARSEFDEPHAGILFMEPRADAPTPEAASVEAVHGRLKLRGFTGWQVPLPQSTGAADDAVQACNYRTTLTTNPASRVPITKPAHYDPYYFRSLEIFAGIERVPNDKFGWNRPQLVGRQTPYVEADWKTRQQILDEHWDVTMGLLYFLQHDATVPGRVREAWLEYGLAADEFVDNGHRPYEMYIREARRITGRAVFTQHDAMLAEGLGRAPVHSDSIAMTEWYIDSHSCTPARVPRGLEEGKMMLHQETFPGQVAYRCLLPQGVDNLLVPVCVSSTHVGWNVIRLEPVFMQTGEAAGLAAALALRGKMTVAEIEADELVRSLCGLRSMVTFFNDVDVKADDPAIPAVLYFGTQGFFADYDARAGAPLSKAVAKIWLQAFAALRLGKSDPATTASAVAKIDAAAGEPITAREFNSLLGETTALPVAGDAVVTRGQALLALWNLLGNKK